MSTSVVINVQDKSAQSTRSYPRTVTDVPVYDLSDRYFFDSATRINIVAPDIDQFVIPMTDGNHGAAMPDFAEFIEDRTNMTTININAPLMYPRIIHTTEFISITGEAGDDSGESVEETHEIRGTVTEDSKIIVLDTATNELVKAENVSKGSYTVSLPNRTVDVLAKTIDDGEPSAYTGVTPVQKQ